MSSCGATGCRNRLDLSRFPVLRMIPSADFRLSSLRVQFQVQSLANRTDGAAAGVYLRAQPDAGGNGFRIRPVSLHRRPAAGATRTPRARIDTPCAGVESVAGLRRNLRGLRAPFHPLADQRYLGAYHLAAAVRVADARGRVCGICRAVSAGGLSGARHVAAVARVLGGRSLPSRRPRRARARRRHARRYPPGNRKRGPENRADSAQAVPVQRRAARGWLRARHAARVAQTLGQRAQPLSLAVALRSRARRFRLAHRGNPQQSCPIARTRQGGADRRTRIAERRQFPPRQETRQGSDRGRLRGRRQAHPQPRRAQADGDAAGRKNRARPHPAVAARGRNRRRSRA